MPSKLTRRSKNSCKSNCLPSGRLFVIFLASGLVGVVSPGMRHFFVGGSRCAGRQGQAPFIKFGLGCGWRLGRRRVASATASGWFPSVTVLVTQSNASRLAITSGCNSNAALVSPRRLGHFPVETQFPGTTSFTVYVRKWKKYRVSGNVLRKNNFHMPNLHFKKQAFGEQTWKEISFIHSLNRARAS